MSMPSDLEGMRVLDLACRSGKGACKLADRVGPRGFVLGVDPDARCVARASERASRDHAAGEDWPRFLAFRQACFEDLAAAGVACGSFNVAYVNSAVNLAWDLPLALREIRRALAPGGYLWVAAGVFSVGAAKDARMEAAARAGDALEGANAVRAEAAADAMRAGDAATVARAAGDREDARMEAAARTVAAWESDARRVGAAAGNVFAAAVTREAFARLAREAGFSACVFGETRPAVPDGSDAAPYLEGRTFETCDAKCFT